MARLAIIFCSKLRIEPMIGPNPFSSFTNHQSPSCNSLSQLKSLCLSLSLYLPQQSSSNTRDDAPILYPCPASRFPSLLPPLPPVTTGEDDVKCLKGMHDSLGDPENRLSSWSFTNTSAGAICSFTGVSCWNSKENRVLALSIPEMSLTGSIPSFLQYCHSVTTLDLSSNNLSGAIPPELCNWLPFLVSLDLSSNNLTGPIPSELGDCKFLNSLKLSSNSLSGQIPASLSWRNRLKTINFSDNQLTGSIPTNFSSFDAADFEKNPSLCGSPLSSCRPSRKLVIITAASVFSAIFIVCLLFALLLYLWGENWARTLKK